MKSEAVGHSLIVNGKLQEVKDTKVFEEIEEAPVYEVIRIIDGVPLFFEEHLDRMKGSANIIKMDLARQENEIKEDVIRLIQKNNIVNQNIKLISTKAEEIGNTFIIYQIKSFYPPRDYYTRGIHTILINHEREEPNAKILQINLKNKIADELKKYNAFEALLINKEGDIVEGSRSNIFFVKDNKVYTARGSDVLLGITRSHIFNICEKLNIDVVEKNINIDDIDKIEGAFMTGTSVNVLPITTLGKYEVDSISNRIIIEINNQYIAEIENYTLINKDKWI